MHILVLPSISAPTCSVCPELQVSKETQCSVLVKKDVVIILMWVGSSGCATSMVCIGHLPSNFIVCCAWIRWVTKDQAKHFVLVVVCYKALPRMSKKQAEQRISSRFIMYVLGIHDLSFKNTQRSRRSGKSAESQKLKKTRDSLDSAQKHKCGTTVERYFEDEQYQRRMQEQGYTQSDMEEFDRLALERKNNYVATPEERRYYRDQYKVAQPNQGGGSDTANTKQVARAQAFTKSEREGQGRGGC